MDSALISIIMPCHNEQAYIAEAIRSVQAQTYENWELIIADDHSNDATADIIKEFASAEPRIKPVYMSSKAGSAGPVRNNALSVANGRYIAFLDADDLWKPEKLQSQLLFMRKYGSGLCTTHTEIIDLQGNVTGQYRPNVKSTTWHDMLTDNVISTSAVMIDRTLFAEVNFPNVKRCQDYACWMALLGGGGRAHIMPKCLTQYRIDPDGLLMGKIRNAYYRWRVHRDILGRSFIQSIFDIAGYTAKGLRKTKGYINK